MNLKLEGNYDKTIDLRNVELKKINLDSKSEKRETRNGVEVKSPMLEAMSLLEKLPDVRAEKISLGQRLVARSDYPNDETLEKVADALLGNGDIYDE